MSAFLPQSAGGGVPEREARFLAAVAADPVLVHVRLVYVVGPSIGPDPD